ncbi:MAG: hypothetical protein Q8P24_04625 [Desulfobacterales bacterium]|nr:hypothetical protein [Desulfobacterales bacterium]
MEQPDIRLQIESAINDPELPKVYSNSFSCALGFGDTVILFKNGSKPVALLNMSFTTAKTLAIKIQDLIARLENTSGNKIMTTGEIEMFFKEDIEKIKKERKNTNGKKNV